MQHILTCHCIVFPDSSSPGVEWSSGGCPVPSGGFRLKGKARTPRNEQSLQTTHDNDWPLEQYAQGSVKRALLQNHDNRRASK